MNHIKVELDFIPVEERLPERTGKYAALYPDRQHPWEFTLCSVIGSQSAGTGKAIFASGRPTHWAEIPEIGD